MVSVSYIIAQLLGLIALGFQSYSGQAKQRYGLTLFLGISNVFWMGHYIFLDIPLAAVICGLIAVQLIVSTFLQKKHRRPTIIIFILLYWIAAYFAAEEAFHLLPVIGTSLISLSLLTNRVLVALLPAIGTTILSLSLLNSESVILVRFGAITSFSTWMVHGFFTGSIVEILANALPLATAIYGLMVHDIGMKTPKRKLEAPDRRRRSQEGGG